MWSERWDVDDVKCFKSKDFTSGSFFRLLLGHETGVPKHMPSICVVWNSGSSALVLAWL